MRYMSSSYDPVARNTPLAVPQAAPIENHALALIYEAILALPDLCTLERLWQVNLITPGGFIE